VRKTAMQLIRVSVEPARKKIEIWQIGQQYQHAELRNPLVPLCCEPPLPLRCQNEKGPESCKSVCYWRGHVTQRFGAAGAAISGRVRVDSGASKSLS